MSFNTIGKTLNWSVKALKQLASRRSRFVVARPPFIARQVLYDKKTRSRIMVNTRDKIDRAVIKQIFVEEDYGLRVFDRHQDISARYEEICASGRVPLIIDAGANIGASCLYFANEFPRAHVIGIEPEPNNFHVASENCRNTSNIQLLHAGLASAAGRANIHNPTADNWAFQTRVDTQGDLALVSINELVAGAEKNNQIPFLVKIDVEGFEENIFAANTEWVDQFYVLIIELHDWMLPRQANSRHFLECIAPLGRDFVYRAENVFSIKN
ncbi:FkbM family methyltransferase [Pollutimonas bauzanensis]|uniref:Methyltransferase, FkbM family n=1 Tax=Pollutimonas bauzanensis TaxID=658167 RepID=A0A1M5UPY6_9BURK|nr:FkbM family methyltransferase [Pollutimonas bauzanensis]SHH64723.1 methyltransferase, FkbM family [Pollutimonas bauzanensis]